MIADAAGAPREVDAELERRAARPRRRPDRRARRGRHVASRTRVERHRLGVGDQPLAVHRDRRPRRADSRAAARRRALVETFAKPIVSKTRCTSGSRSACRRRSLRPRAPASPSCRRRPGSGRRRLRPGRCSSPPPPARDRRAARSRSRRRASGRPARRRPARRRSAAPCVAPWNARTIRSISSQLPSCASSRSSIRLAPAEKFGASLPTTSAAKFAAASFTPACSIWIVSPPIAFIFEWNSTREHAVAEVDEAGAGVLPDDRAAGPSRDAGSADRRRRPASRTLSPRTAQLATIGGDVRRQRVEHVVHADRVPRLERAELPAEAPPHRAIDVVDRVGDRRARRVAV